MKTILLYAELQGQTKFHLQPLFYEIKSTSAGKQKLEVDSSVPISWDEFKAFFQKTLEDSRAFVDSY